MLVDRNAHDEPLAFRCERKLSACQVAEMIFDALNESQESRIYRVDDQSLVINSCHGNMRGGSIAGLSLRRFEEDPSLSPVMYL